VYCSIENYIADHNRCIIVGFIDLWFMKSHLSIDMKHSEQPGHDENTRSLMLFTQVGGLDMKTTRVCFPEINRVELTEVEIDKPEVGGMLVENMFTMISPGTELALYTGLYQNLAKKGSAWARYPVFPGYAAVGRVVMPPDDLSFSKGDIIFYPAKHGAHDWFDAFSGLAFDISDFEHPEFGVFVRFGQIAITALRVADFQAGESVVVMGLGIIGNLAAQLFRLSGADVIGVDMVPGRRRIAELCGVTTLDPQEEKFREAILDLTRGTGSQVVVDATGVPGVVNTALEIAAECGQVILLGSPRGLAEVNLYSYVHVKGVSLVGAHERMQRMPTRNRAGRWDRIANSRFVVQCIRNESLKVEPLITDIFSPDCVHEAYDKLCNSKEDTLGVLIDWRGLSEKKG
jgi:2-desacetyl-2-hydroxyethyl bacteriochlorophyllide A dehydrogenase